jgi:RNA recognition motif-containing protein
MSEESFQAGQTIKILDGKLKDSTGYINQDADGKAKIRSEDGSYSCKVNVNGSYANKWVPAGNITQIPEEEVVNPKKKKADNEAENQSPQKKVRHNKKKAIGGSINEKVYISNLPYNLARPAVKSFFERCGEITDISNKLLADGHGFITFNSSDAADAAVQMDGSSFNGRNIRTCFAYPNCDRYNRAPSKRVWVGLFARAITKGDVMKFFGDHAADISEITVLEKKEVRFCYVTFDALASAKAALKMDGHSFLGKAMKVSFAAPKVG